MERLRHLPRTILLPALLAVAALLVLAFERSDGLSDALAGDALGTLLSVTIGLGVAAVVLSRVSARR
jgi:ABC-type nitrate/sulfonate/bicarbonate transport system permease component